jgi:hypothetical protein
MQYLGCIKERTVEPNCPGIFHAHLLLKSRPLQDTFPAILITSHPSQSRSRVHFLSQVHPHRFTNGVNGLYPMSAFVLFPRNRRLPDAESPSALPRATMHNTPVILIACRPSITSLLPSYISPLSIPQTEHPSTQTVTFRFWRLCSFLAIVDYPMRNRNLLFHVATISAPYQAESDEIWRDRRKMEGRSVWRQHLPWVITHSRRCEIQC